MIGRKVKASAEQVEAGQAVYSARTLRVYDFVVLGVSNRFIWKCPTARLEEHYNKHVSTQHLDVGVGSGYFLDRCRFPSPAPFDSVGINYLLHCLPGSIEAKAVVFDHLKALMNPGAVLFGSTLLQGGVPRAWSAKRLMAIYNKKGIFSNELDPLDGLKTSLSGRFREVSIEVIGCAALFSGRV